MLLRPHRSHRLTLLAAGALLATPLLGGCGFDYATDRVNTISAGINDRAGSVDVLGAVVIAGQDNVGLFVATLVNNDLEEPVSLDGLQQTDEVSGAEESVEIPAAGRANLFDTGGIEVTGTFAAGSFVDVTLAFSNGQVTSIEIPVVTPCRQYSPDLFPNLELPEAPVIDPGTGTEAPEEAAGEAAEEVEGVEEEAASEEELEPGPYSCETAPQVEHHGGEE